MIIALAIFLWLGVASGIAVFLFQEDKGKRDAVASGLVGLAWPVLLIGIPVAVALKRLDEASK